MKQKGDARKAKEDLEAMVNTLLAEGYAVFSPDQNRIECVRAYKIAVGAKPQNTKDLEYEVHIDWLTDNVIFRVYSMARKTSAAVALINREWLDKPPTQLLTRVQDLWSQLEAVFRDASKVIELQAQTKAMDALWSKVRTQDEAQRLYEKHRAMIGAPSDLSNFA